VPTEAAQLKELFICPVREVVDSSTPGMIFGMRIVGFDLCHALCKQALPHFMLSTAIFISPSEMTSVSGKVGHHTFLGLEERRTR
jgi:hypothetical protein